MKKLCVSYDITDNGNKGQNNTIFIQNFYLTDNQNDT